MFSRRINFLTSCNLREIMLSMSSVEKSKDIVEEEEDDEGKELDD